MTISKCPRCNKKHIILSRPSIKDENYPLTICPSCLNAYVPEILQKRVSKPYEPPKKYQIALCGLVVGIIGIVLIIFGIMKNKILVMLLGSLLFSFWILMIGMSLALWKEILKNSKIEYDTILEHIHDGKAEG